MGNNINDLHQCGDKASNWKGGKIKVTKGYIWQYLPEHHFANSYGYVPEHRLIWEKFHKCCLLSYIDIHHINHNTSDNKIENLEAITKHNHGLIHGKQKKNKL